MKWINYFLLKIISYASKKNIYILSSSIKYAHLKKINMIVLKKERKKVYSECSNQLNEDPGSGTAEWLAKPHFTLARLWTQGH